MNLLQSIANDPNLRNTAQSIANNPIVQSIANNPAIKNISNELLQRLQTIKNNPEYIKYIESIIKGIVPFINVNGMTFKLNVLISDVQPTDKQYLGASAPLTTIDLRPQLLPVRNQGSVSSCVSFSTSCMKEYQAKTNNYFSPAFIYHSRSNYPTDCMTIKNALDILSVSGVCYDNTYSYSNVESTSSIPQNAINEAEHFKIISYAQINDINSLKTALENYGPCPIAFPVYNFSDQLWIQNPGDTFKGGHCMTVVGYDDSSFIIRNSWGNSWANQGYTNYPFTQWGTHWEVWTCTGYPPPGSILPSIKTSTNLSTNTIIIIISIIICILFIIILIIIFSSRSRY